MEEESTNTVARLVKLLDGNGFDVTAIQSGSDVYRVGDASLTVIDRWAAERRAAE